MLVLPKTVKAYSQNEQRLYGDKKMAKQVWATQKWHIFWLN